MSKYDSLTHITVNQVLRRIVDNGDRSCSHSSDLLSLDNNRFDHIKVNVVQATRLYNLRNDLVDTCGRFRCK